MDGVARTLVFLLVILGGSSSGLTQQWQQTATSPKGSGITGLAVRETSGHVYATTGSFNWPNADTGGVHRSTDGGDTWTRVYRANIARTIAIKSNGTIFASVRPTTSEGLYYSTNDGQDWALANDRGPNDNVFSIAFDTVSFINPNTVYFGTRFGVYRNYGGGVGGPWSLRTTGLPPGSWIRGLAVGPLPAPALYGIVIAATMNPFNPAANGVYYSTNQGENFLQATGIAMGDTVVSMTIVDSTASSSHAGVSPYYVIIGTSNGRVYIATLTANELFFRLLAGFPAGTEVGSIIGIPGSTAVQLYLSVYSVLPLANSGVYFSNSFGLTWEQYVNGITLYSLVARLASFRVPSAVTSAATYTLYAGLFMNQNNGALVYRATNVVNNVNDGGMIPEGFALAQNYPNPFNPTTTIKYQLQIRNHVSITIFDLLGREVATLVNEERDPGLHEVAWDATGYASGMYLYRLYTDGYATTKKLVFLK